jgi:hypothetical protein
VFAPQKTTDAIFDALKSLAAYATTGERILLDVDLNGAKMGQRTSFSEVRRVRGYVVGTAPIERVTLVKNGRDLWTKDVLTDKDGHSSRYLISFQSPTDPVIRDSPRGGRPWRGSITVSGAHFGDVWASSFKNIRADSFERVSENEIQFQTVTRGGKKGIVFELKDASSAAHVVIKLEAITEVTSTPARLRPIARLPSNQVTLRIADLVEGRVDHKLSVDRHVDTVSLRRITADPPLEIDFEYTDAEAPDHGDYYYVRVTQLDGGTAWSSPIWVGGQSAR